MKCIASIIVAFSAIAATAQQTLNLPANLQIFCGPYAPLANMLGENHGERLLHTGKTAAGHEIQQWLNVEGGNWSVILRDGDIGCLVAKGKEFDPDPTGDKGQPS